MRKGTYETPPRLQSAKAEMHIPILYCIFNVSARRNVTLYNRATL